MRFGMIALLGIVALGGVLAVIHGLPAHAAQSNRTQYSATKGVLTPVGVVNPRALPADTSAGSVHSRAPRATHAHATASAATASHIVASSATVAAAKTGSLIRNFNGTSSHDSAVTNFGLEFEPPDQGLCVGNGFVLEPVNSAYNIYRNDGTLVVGPINVNALFGEGLKQFTSDPRCLFDKATHTWFASILFINDKNTAARTDLAVNTSGDPTTPWTIYHIDATDNGNHGMPNHPGCPCFGDQPLIGIDQFNVYISTNEFSILGSQFNGAQIYALSKSDLVALDHPVHFVHFDNLTSGGAIAASVQPAITYGSSDAEYFMNSLDPNGTGDNRIGVWALTNRNAVFQGNVPVLSSVVITSEPYAIPPGAMQQGASSLLDSGDDRMQQVENINGDLWGELTTAVTISGDSTTRAGAAWFKVHAHLNGQVIGGASIRDQGYVAVAGNYLIYPAIQEASTGAVAMIMTLSGPTFFPSVVYGVLTPGQTQFTSLRIAAFGSGSYSPNSTRWGDYSFAVLDPNNQGIWLATEYVPPLSSQTPDGLQNWGTRVIEVNAKV
jgi:hypothetical protein